jgi:hypothetical protein
MNRESKIDENYSQNQERVIKHLQRTDWLFIILPMVLSGILLIVVPIIMLASEKIRGNRTDIAGFDFGGLVIIAGIILFLIFCGGYGVFAFILSLLVRRNITFRILLFAVPLLTISILFFQAGLHRTPHIRTETEEIPAETQEAPEETPANSGG